MDIETLRLSARAQRAAIAEKAIAEEAAETARIEQSRENRRLLGRKLAAESLPTTMEAVASAVGVGETSVSLPNLAKRLGDDEVVAEAAQQSLGELLGQPFTVCVRAGRTQSMGGMGGYIPPQVTISW